MLLFIPMAPSSYVQLVNRTRVTTGKPFSSKVLSTHQLRSSHNHPQTDYQTCSQVWGSKRSGWDEQNHFPWRPSSRLLRGSTRLRFPVLHSRTAGWIPQSDGDSEAGRDPGLQRLWRPTHLHRLAQGGAHNDALYKKKPIALHIRGADRFTATQKGFPLSKPTPPQAWWPALL